MDARPIKRTKLKPADDIPSVSPKPKACDAVIARAFPPVPPSTATLAFAHPSLTRSDQPAVPPSLLASSSSSPPSYTIDLNGFKANGMNIIFAPSTGNPAEPAAPSNLPLVLTFGNLSYPPT